ncbi:multidrug efflux SMR transporter [Phaeovibrio sulfidiphilus]|uniref:Spermidine export protein MdtJ n=1 Tax=Phaeovibrio sulfidiphilus TaxID=1220600 RepID=A0A8J7CPR3_9PROT|nr:multidrug efflux SMR transporter [Phaeovibrio sulfidiphilus]MBE1237337.1 multidrug efflux SMR transporter [Phaeovibrio sulfidiphilus]
MAFLFRNRSWFYLAMAIVLEVSGTVTMKVAHMQGSGLSPASALMLMYVLIGFSYAFLALAVTRMPIGVAYAFWEGIGLSVITLVGIFALGEVFTWQRFLALAAIVAGAILIHNGTAMTPKKKKGRVARRSSTATEPLTAGATSGRTVG